MESSSSRQAFTLASIIDAEKLVPPQRAHVLLASLAGAKTIPSGPVTVREWSEVIIVERDPGGAERAIFAAAGAAPSVEDREATVVRHLEAMRAAAVAMVWGRETVQGPDGKPRYPRLRRLLVDQWDETRGNCEGPDKLLMLFDATLALDRAAEPKAGRDGFKSLSLPNMDAAKKKAHVGTIGVPFEALIDTGHLKKGIDASPDEGAKAGNTAPGKWATPQVSSVAQSSSPRPISGSQDPAERSMRPIITAVVLVLLVGALAFAFVLR